MTSPGSTPVLCRLCDSDFERNSELAAHFKEKHSNFLPKIKFETTQQQQREEAKPVPVDDDVPELQTPQPPSTELEEKGPLVAKVDVQDEVDLASGKIPSDQNQTMPEPGKSFPKSGTKFDCNLCDEKCKKKPELLKHINQCHEDEARTLNLIGCKLCGSVYSNKKSLQKHLRKATCGHNDNFNISGKENNDESTTSEKMISKKIISSKKENINSGSKMTSSKTAKIKCEFCSDSFWKTLYLTHVNLVHRPEAEALNWISCPDCQVLFATTHGHNCHVRMIHSKTKTKLGKKVTDLKHLDSNPPSGSPLSIEKKDIIKKSFSKSSAADVKMIQTNAVSSQGSNSKLKLKKTSGRKKKTSVENLQQSVIMKLEQEEGKFVMNPIESAIHTKDGSIISKREFEKNSQSTAKRNGKPNLPTNPEESLSQAKRKYTKKSKVDQFKVANNPVVEVVQETKSLNPDPKNKSNEKPVEEALSQDTKSLCKRTKRKKTTKLLSGESTDSSSSDFFGFESTEKKQPRKVLTEVQLNGSILQTLAIPKPKRKYIKKSKVSGLQSQGILAKSIESSSSIKKTSSARNKKDPKKASNVSHLYDPTIVRSQNLESSKNESAYPSSCLDTPSSLTPSESLTD